LRWGIWRVISEIKKHMPAIVGISVNLYTYQVCLKLVAEIKEYFPKAFIILGGPTPSSIPFKLINASRVDAIVVGEGEEAFGDIIANYKNKKHLFKGVKGLIYRQQNEIITNEPRGFAKDINAFSPPAYHLFPDLNMYKTRAKRRPAASLITSRGCPYQCVFCSKDVFKNICRARSPENVISEIDLLVKKHGVKQIDILDDNFLIDKNRAEKILDLLIERNYDLCVNFQSGIRTENLDQNMIGRMKKAKVWKLAIGVESGDSAVLKTIKKQLDLNKVLAVTQMAKRAGIKVYGFFIIGLPGDSASSMQKTIDFAIKMDPQIANFCICIPFPGTELYQMIKKEGRFLVDIDYGINAGFYANRVFYEMQGLDKTTVLKYYKKALKDFYFRPAKILELAKAFTSKDEIRWFFDTGFSLINNLWKKDMLKF
jgi:radical SAM superfamily enzyme YgiQ (UPF0313 family)